ncbi:MAG: hypothetical protein J6I45_02240 [Clostridia bacterium]|nr:hypothetical protein [Clostridia bacterium]
MKFKVRLTALLLAALMLLPACANEDDTAKPTIQDETTVAATTPAEETKELTDAEKRALVPDDLPDINFDGREFNIICRNFCLYEFESEEESGDTIGDAVYRRNLKVEDRFGVEIITHGFGENTMYNIFSNMDKSIKANDDAYQLGAAYSFFGTAAAVNGGYVNWYDLDYINLEKPWWSREYLEAASYDNVSFIANGDLSLLFNEVTLAIFFNKKIAEDFALGNIYEIVSSGAWTLDKLSEHSKLVAADLDGNSVMDTEDRYGLATNNCTHLDNFVFSSNISTVERNENGYPVVVINNEKTIALLETLKELLVGSSYNMINNDGMYALPDGMFANNQALYMTSWLGDASRYRDMEADFGIIPYPKYDEKQENYATSFLDRTDIFVIPVTADLEFVPIITEVMAAESYKLVIPAFYDIALKTKYSRDNESQEMIDLILDNIKFDFGHIYANFIGGTPPSQYPRNVVTNNKSKDFSSLYASAEKVVNKNIEKLIGKFEKAMG